MQLIRKQENASQEEISVTKCLYCKLQLIMLQLVLNLLCFYILFKSYE